MKEGETDPVVIEVIRQMLTLATGALTLVAALAWNTFVQAFFEKYLTEWLGKTGGLASLFCYAVVVSVLAVVAGIQLSRVIRKLEVYK